MKENFVLLSAIAKMLEDNRIEVVCNANAKTLAYEFDLEKSISNERENFYKNLVIDIIKILDDTKLKDFECIENIVYLFEKSGLNGGG